MSRLKILLPILRIHILYVRVSKRFGAPKNTPNCRISSVVIYGLERNTNFCFFVKPASIYACDDLSINEDIGSPFRFS